MNPFITIDGKEFAIKMSFYKATDSTYPNVYLRSSSRNYWLCTWVNSGFYVKCICRKRNGFTKTSMNHNLTNAYLHSMKIWSRQYFFYKTKSRPTDLATGIIWGEYTRCGFFYLTVFSWHEIGVTSFKAKLRKKSGKAMYQSLTGCANGTVVCP